ncbi:MAG: Uncharacterised protein [Halieaceae bacterium]|nr:MAG: Uncharacterised protein [Halieaceae bacterium]
MLESLRRDLGEPRRQLSCRLIRAPKEIVVERELGQLLRHRLLDALLAVAQIAAPQPRHTVLNFIAIRVVDINMLGAADDAPPVLGIIFKIREGMQMVRLIQLFECLRIERRGHGAFSSDLACLTIAARAPHRD